MRCKLQERDSICRRRNRLIYLVDKSDFISMRSTLDSSVACLVQNLKSNLDSILEVMVYVVEIVMLRLMVVIV